MNRSCRILASAALSALSLLLGTAVAGAVASDPPPPVKLEATSPASHPLGVPILAMVKVINTGTVPIFYSSGGPGRYPGAWQFSATVIDADGVSHDSQPTNGQYESWFRGAPFAVNPGDAIATPLVLPPLPEGDYTVLFATPDQAFGGTGQRGPGPSQASPLHLTVIRSQAAAARWNQDLLQRVRGGNPFARHVVRQFHIDPIIAALLGDLAADDPAVVLNATESLYRVKPLPPEAAAILRRAVVRYLDQPALPKPVKTDLYANLLVNLGLLAPAAGTDEALDTVLLIARAHAFADPSLNDEVRRWAVWDLADFPQRKAHAALTEFLRDGSAAVRSSARQALANR